MRARYITLVAGLGLTFVLGACSAEAQSFERSSALVDAMEKAGVECSGLEKADAGELLSDHGFCTIDGEAVDIYIFENAEDRDRWLNFGQGLGEVVTGPNWTVDAGEHADAVAEALTGEIR